MVVLEGGAAAEYGAALGGDLAREGADDVRVDAAHLGGLGGGIVGEPFLEELEDGHDVDASTVLELDGAGATLGVELQHRIDVAQCEGVERGGG